jgi:hypothetical protein
LVYDAMRYLVVLVLGLQFLQSRCSITSIHLIERKSDETSLNFI